MPMDTKGGIDMEQRLIRSDIKKCQKIDYHPDYFLFSGDLFQSCSRQGGPLFTYPEVKYFPVALSILPNNKLLIEDARSTFHVLDLEKGKVLASKRMPKQVICSRRFAVSNDGKTAFRTWLKGDKYFLAIINLCDLSCRICPYNVTLNLVADLVYKAENELLVLETQVANDGVCHNQVTSVLIVNNQCLTTPVYRWEGEQCGKYFDGKYVLETGYQIRDLDTNKVFSLLENSEHAVPENFHALSRVYYPEEKYLQLIDRNHTVFIDCSQRKIIARYQQKSREEAFVGMYTGEEFWFGKADGIYAVPFPAIEQD